MILTASGWRFSKRKSLGCAKVDGERYGVIGRTSPDLLTMDWDQSLDDAMFDDAIQSILESREQERDKAEAEGSSAPLHT